MIRRRLKVNIYFTACMQLPGIWYGNYFNIKIRITGSLFQAYYTKELSENLICGINGHRIKWNEILKQF